MQFKSVRDLVYTKVSELQKNLTEKLEYHERHDDARFGQVINDLWAIKVRNAAKDGAKAIPELEKASH